MKRLMLVVAVVALAWSPKLSADRLTDKDLKDLIDRIYQERDRFEDQLDGDIKHKVLRGAAGEVKVDKFLDDFQESVSKLQDRMKGDYAASAEAAAVLRQGTSIDRFMKTQPAAIDGGSEWTRLAGSLKSLAAAYGADFPLPEGAAVRRLGDKEVATLVDSLAKGGDQLKKSLDNELKKDKSVDAATRQSVVDAADQFTEGAKALRDRVKGGDPSAGEAEQLMQRASAMRSILKSRPVPSSAGLFAGLAPRLEQLASLYAMPMPAVR
jgi:hypothetical protein